MKNVFKVLLAMLLLGMVTPYQVRAEISKAAAENSSQQQKERLLRGLVTDKDGLPLPGVTVQVKGTTQGTTTDGEGEYYIMVKGVENPVLVFSFIGMETQEIPFEKASTASMLFCRNHNKLWKKWWSMVFLPAKRNHLPVQRRPSRKMN